MTDPIGTAVARQEKAYQDVDFHDWTDEEFKAWLAQQVEPWQIADALLDRFPESEHPIGDANSGLYKRLGEYERAIYKDHGVRLKANTMRNARATAAAWPRATRVARASFKVHSAMRGKDRRAEMAKRMKQAQRENRALSYEMLVRLRADEKGAATATVSDNERLRRRIESAVKAVIAEGIIKSSLPDPDWWNGKSISDHRRSAAVDELRALADRIEGRQ